MKPLIVSLAALALWLGSWSTACGAGQPAFSLQATHFITYSPRSFAVQGTGIRAATDRGIRDDLRLLRPWFDGLICYSARHGLEQIPAVAQELGFQAVILGVWDPRSEEEIANVIRLAKGFPTLVRAVVVGNEGIYTRRYRAQEVGTAVGRIKKDCPRLAVTTSEPFFLYFTDEHRAFFQSLDLVMPNVHPVFEPWFKASEPGRGVEMVLGVVGKFKADYRQPLLVKETGLPSGLAESGYSPERQAAFWSELQRRFPYSATCSLACFEAFDAPWKPATIAADFPGLHESEAHWGFFTIDGSPKPVVSILPKAR